MAATLPFADATCPTHQRAASATCDRCGAFCCDQCAEHDVGIRRCDACGVRAAPGLDPLDWDDRDRPGLIRSFARTWWRLIAHPLRTFERMEPRHSATWRPFFFAMVCCLARGFGAHGPSLASTLVELANAPDTISVSWRLKVAAGSVAMILVPTLLWVVLRVFILGGLEHFLLFATRSASRGVEPTIRGACYSTAPLVFVLVPPLWWVADLWSIALRVLAYRTLHRNRGWHLAAVVGAVLLTAIAYALPHGYDEFIGKSLELFRTEFLQAGVGK